jgi:hypothetical protein
MLCPFGREKPSTDSEKRTTRFSLAMSASGWATITFMTASAISFLTWAVRQVLGSHVMWTNGMVVEVLCEVGLGWMVPNDVFVVAEGCRFSTMDLPGWSK